MNRGGVLVRFAGPRLEKGGDDLLPVPLRLGGRTLGGALSWSTPQPLAPFDDTGLFAGLAVPPDVTVSRQVLADPAQLTGDIKVWARLHDGTPLVTAAKRGAGQIVLFHNPSLSRPTMPNNMPCWPATPTTWSLAQRWPFWRLTKHRTVLPATARNF